MKTVPNSSRMASVTFVLRNPNNNQRTNILVVFRHSNIRIKRGTAKYIHPNFWNKERNEARKVIEVDHQQINSYLRKIKDKILKAYEDFIEKEIKPGKDQMEEKILQILEGRDAFKGTFYQFIEHFIQTTSKADSTKKSYRDTLNKLKLYKKNLSFEEINLQFYDDFKLFCHQRGNGVNLFGKHIKHVKVFMRQAYNRGLTKNTDYSLKEFKVTEEEKESEVLSPEEIDRLHTTFMPPSIRKAVDFFLIGCCTGFRVSDLNRLNKHRVKIKDGKEHIDIETQKTGTPVFVPLNSMALEILKKYDYEPGGMSPQKINQYIKQGCILAGIDDVVFETKTDLMGKKTETKRNKYELITIHSARRSFATNLYKAGAPVRYIMKLTGHKKEETFFKYIRIDADEATSSLSDHPFFQ